MNKKILFRADGNGKMGLGHLYRLFAVAEMLKGDYDFCFVTRNSTTLSVIPKNYGLELIPDEITITSEPSWLVSKFPPTEFIIVADGYAFDSVYQKEVKKIGYQLVYIDDLIQESMSADIVINHLPCAEISDFTAEKYTRFGLGTKYALMRPAFLEAAKRERKIGDMTTAFVCFGGADPLDLTSKAAEALLKISTITNIHVVIGGAYSGNGLFVLEKRFSKKLHAHRNLSEDAMASLMASCDLAIAPASTILYELCCIGMPILGGFYVDNQKQIYSALKENGAIFPGGDFTKYSISGFQEKLEKIIGGKDLTTHIQQQKTLFDGKSDKRILGLINSLNLSFRKAHKDDVQLTYEWSNDPLVRENSYTSKTIPLENHTEWFLNKIDSSDTLFLIVLVNESPAGVVRYEVNNTNAIVGISISKSYRGQNLAPTILERSASIYFDTFAQPVLAYVKKENLASIRAFEKAGYSFLRDETIKGHDSCTYKLERTDET